MKQTYALLNFLLAEVILGAQLVEDDRWYVLIYGHYPVIGWWILSNYWMVVTIQLSDSI